MKKLLVAATFAALTITTPTTVSAKANVRYSTGIVTGAKSITTTDGNVWRTKRKLHLRKGTNVQVKFDTKGTKRKKDDAILKVSKMPKANQENPEISIPISDIALVYTDSLGYTTLVNQKDTYMIRFRKNPQKHSWFIRDDIVWYPIREISKTDKVENVYNIEVKEDHTYTANNIITFNCQDFSVAGKQKGSIWTCKDCNHEYNPLKVTQNNNDDKIICASRGRNPENPSDRTPGAPTEQRLEFNRNGCTNTLTSVQKDNYVFETNNIRIRKLTPRESIK